MPDDKARINALESKNREHYKELKRLQKKTMGLLWMWNILPIFGSLIWANLKFKRLSEEPYYSQAIEIKVEIAKNEMEIIKIKKLKEK